MSKLLHILFSDGVPLEDKLKFFTVPELCNIVERFVELPRDAKHLRGPLLEFVAARSTEVQNTIRQAASVESGKGRKRRREETAGSVGKRQRLDIGGEAMSTDWRWNNCDDAVVQSDEALIHDLISGPFFNTVGPGVRARCVENYISRTSNATLRQGVCLVCARLLFTKDMELMSIDKIPNRHLLKPSDPHLHQVLFDGVLLHEDRITDEEGQVCKECLRTLEKGRLPALSLANNLWIGQIPKELAILTLPERVLVARHLPCTYLVKLYPKAENVELWAKEDSLYYGLKGNVSTHPLNSDHIAGLVSSMVFPPQARVLAAVIGITFVTPSGVKQRQLPRMFHVRRSRVHAALLWLKRNNPLYKDIIISEEALSQLPVDGVPEEMLSTIRTSHDMVGLAG